MRIIILGPSTKFRWSKADKTFYFSEKDIPFDTSYELKNPNTGNSSKFEFSHSTGGEFDPNTQWVYKGPNEMKMVVSNDPNITNQRANMYLQGKLKKETNLKLENLIRRLIKEEREDPEVQKLIDDIVTFRTLPPQIDYTRPYKIKAEAALEKLKKLPNYKQYLKIIDDEVSEYYNSDISDLDAQF